MKSLQGAVLALIIVVSLAGCGGDGGDPGPQVCTSTCDTAGQAFCAGDGFRVCELGADGCFALGPVAACPAGETCSLGACSGTCVDECATIDTDVCDGAAVRRCGQLDGDSCLDLGEPSLCSSGGCADGACSSTCVDTCPQEGARECVGNGFRTCGNFDADACLEWSQATECANTDSPCLASTCQNGACAVTPAPDGAACGIGPCSTGGKCTAGRCEGASEGCGPGESCTNNTCTCDNTVDASGGLVTGTLDLPAASVTFDLRINGQPAPTNLPENERGYLVGRHAGSTEWLPIANLGAPLSGSTRRLIPGRYDIRYSPGLNHTWREGILTPENPPTTFTTIDVPNGGGNITIPVEAADVTFQARINGQPAPTNLPENERGRLSIRHRGATEWTLVGEVGGAMIGPSWRLLTGTYEYQYRKSSTHTWREGVLTPENEATTVGTFEIGRNGGMIPLEIQAATVTFNARLNGQPAPVNLPATEIGSLWIRHRGATDWTQVGILGGAMIGPDWRLLTGTYDVQYRRGPQHTWREGVLTPENRNVVFGSLEVPPQGGAIAINIEAATVLFQARLNGQPAPTNLPETEVGILSIRHVGETDWTDIGFLGGQMIGPDWRLVTGTYQVRYRRSNQHEWREGVLTPENPATVVGTIAITAAGGLVPIDVNAATVTLSVRVNGQPGPTNAGETEFGILRMRHEGATEWTDIGTVGGPMIGPDWRLITGRYDVMYDRASTYVWRAGIIAPENREVFFTTVDIRPAGGPVSIPMSAVDVGFTGRLNGQPAPTNLPTTEIGGLTLRHVGSTDNFGVVIAGGPPLAEPWRLVSGTYRLRYDRSNVYQWREGILMPENEDTDYGCIQLKGP